MFVSHFSKWTWFKIYLTFYHSAYWKYFLPQKNKQLMIFGLLLAFPISLFLLKDYFSFVACFWVLMLLIPLISPAMFLFLYSPKTLICYKEYPSEDFQQKIKNSFADKSNTSLNFYRNTLDKTYDLLLETPKYYFIYKNYKKSLVPEPSVILVINKNENQSELDNRNQNFLKFIQPKCKKYIKK
ncbi:hypothetical protein KF282_0807 [Lactococcus lactis subsp. lactis]|jgi:hypothetical protein|uniref:YcxB-like protein domain-containing protein n=2 Tax=Streptococcaceae TaxID=1300 RepID=A0A0V8CZW0_LACLL|nr:hypothetical protein [Lactococcus lactis]KSU06834.1 hypothetical protein KF282_0807 [Lactococcus lactis subsp. lactis]